MIQKLETRSRKKKHFWEKIILLNIHTKVFEEVTVVTIIQREEVIFQIRICVEYLQNLRPLDDLKGDTDTLK